MTGFPRVGRTEAFSMFIIAVLSIAVVLQWFRGGLGLGYTDVGLKFFFPAQWFGQVSNTWYDAQGAGQFFPQLMFVPLAAAMAFFGILGLQTSQLQLILFSLFLFLDGAGMYFLGKVIFKGSDRNSLSLISAIFYMFNPFTMFFVWYRFDSTMWSLPAIPILLGLLIRGLEKRSFKWALQFGAVSLLLASAFGNPAFDAVMALILLLFFAYHVLSSMLHFHASYGRTGLTLGTTVTWWNNATKDPFKSIAVGLTYLATFVGFNAVWLIPWLTSFQSTLTIQSTANLDLNTYLALSPLYGFGYIVRLTRLGMFSWMPVFNSPLIISVTIFIPLFAFGSVLSSHRPRHTLYFIVLILVGLWLGMGANSPAPALSMWMFQNIPGMLVFRNPFEKAGLMVSLAYAPLFAVGLTSAARLLGGAAKSVHARIQILKSLDAVKWGRLAQPAIAFSLLVLIVGGSTWPMLLGTMFQPPPGSPWSGISYYSEVPSYYQEVTSAIHSSVGDGRVLELPLDPTDTSFYNWQYGFQGQEPSNLIFDASTISMKTYNPLIDNMSSALTPIILGHTAQVWKYLSLLSIKYVVVNNDFNTSLIQVHSAQAFRNGLTQMHGNTVLRTESVEELVRNATSAGSNSASGYYLDNETRYQGVSTVGGNESVPEGSYEGGVQFTTTPLNLTNSIISFSVKVQNTTAVQQIRVRIFDSTGNWLMWQAYYAPVPSNVWLPFLLSIDSPDFSSNSRVDLSNITQIYISFLSSQTASTKSPFWISNIDADKSGLLPQPAIQHIGQYGNLDLFQVQDSSFVDRIHVANSSFITTNLNSLLLQVENTSFVPTSSVLFSQDQISNTARIEIGQLQQRITPTSPVPLIRTDKLAASSYKVHINGASTPFFIVFSDTFDPGWAALVNGAVVPYHFLANGFANSWFIDKTGTFDVTIQFMPQSYVSTFALVSLLSVVTAFSLVAIFDHGRFRLARFLKRSGSSTLEKPRSQRHKSQTRLSRIFFLVL